MVQSPLIHPWHGILYEYISVSATYCWCLLWNQIFISNYFLLQEIFGEQMMKCMLNENKLFQTHLNNISYWPHHRMRTICVLIEIQHLVEKIAINTSTFLTNTNTDNTQYKTMPNLSIPMPLILQSHTKANTIKTNTDQNRYHQTPRALVLVHIYLQQAFFCELWQQSHSNLESRILCSPNSTLKSILKKGKNHNQRTFLYVLLMLLVV